MLAEFAKHFYFLCLWDSHATAKYYVRRDWPTLDSYIPGIANIQNVFFVEPKNVLLPPLHTKLGLLKNFVKARGKSNSCGLTFLCKKFAKISETKLKEGIFVGPQIWKVLKDPNFEKTLTAL